MIAEYSFLPWLRRGISNQIQTPATAASRARLAVEVTAASDVATLPVPPKEVQLVGPGDVIGINPQLVIRTEPRHWITDFEPNYLAFIEFYDEDFGWRFTPAAPDTAQHRLTPWIFLLVLKETEFDRDQRPGRPLGSVKLKVGVPIDTLFPPESQLYAWAHVHLNATLGGSGTPNLEQLEVLLRNNPDKGYCRLMSPRRLEPNTGYYAFIIPTFEVGRKAGLGEPVGDADPGLDIAWRVATEFPVYYEWFFRTGKAGDFEELVTALQPRDIDPRVGIRDLDVQQPGFNMPPITSPPDDVVGLEGAVKAPTTASKPLHATSNFPTEIEKQVNLAADATDTGVPGGDDPVVSVPLYGRWHAMVKRINTAEGARNWVNELNGDPRHRATAGMGSLVVQKNQEEYMRLAWQQIGEVLAANRKIRDTQTAMLTSRAIYTKYLIPLPEVRALPVLTPVLKKVMGSPVTVHYLVRSSRLPLAALSGPLRKQLRPRGLIAKRIFSELLPGEGARGRGGVGWLGRVVEQLNEGTVSAALPRKPPAGPTLENAVDRVAPKISEWLRALLPYNRLIAIFVILLLVILAIAAPSASCCG